MTKLPNSIILAQRVLPHVEKLLTSTEWTNSVQLVHVTALVHATRNLIDLAIEQDAALDHDAYLATHES